jgi:DNA-binding CsgD family transcriptional regulator
MTRKDAVIYLLENEEIDRTLLQEVVEQKGFALHKMKDANDVLHFLRIFEKRDFTPFEPEEYGKTQILKENFHSEESLDFFTQLAHLSRWIITILDQMNIALSITRDDKYMMTSQWLPDRIGYKPWELANLRAGDTFIEEDRKKFRNRMALLQKGTISWIESNFHLVKRNKTILEFYSFSFLEKIKNHSYTLTYNINRDNPLWQKSGSESLISLIVHEMHQKISQLINLLCEDFYRNNVSKALNHGNYKEFNLTKREFDILELICNGQTNQEIADSLFISKRTAEAHRARILLKTGSRNTAELVRFTIRNRLIKP